MIELRNVGLHFSRHHVMSGLNWQLADPGVYLLLGSNGSGKSLVCSLLAGRMKPSTGVVEIDGESAGQGQGFSCFYATADSQRSIGETVREYLQVETQYTGVSEAELEPAWEIIADLYPQGRDVALTGLSHGQYLLLQVLLASLIPARLVLLDGHLTYLNQVACAHVENLLAHSPVTMDRYVIFTSNRYAYFVPQFNRTFLIKGQTPTSIVALDKHGMWNEGMDIETGNVIRLVFRDEWTSNDKLVSGANFQLISRNDTGIRIKLTGSVDGMLAELEETGIRPMQLEWET